MVIAILSRVLAGFGWTRSLEDARTARNRARAERELGRLPPALADDVGWPPRKPTSDRNS